LVDEPSPPAPAATALTKAAALLLGLVMFGWLSAWAATVLVLITPKDSIIPVLCRSLVMTERGVVDASSPLRTEADVGVAVAADAGLARA
jgi:hypothetical protein